MGHKITKRRGDVKEREAGARHRGVSVWGYKITIMMSGQSRCVLDAIAPQGRRRPSSLGLPALSLSQEARSDRETTPLPTHMYSSAPDAGDSCAGLVTTMA